MTDVDAENNRFPLKRIPSKFIMDPGVKSGSDDKLSWNEEEEKKIVFFFTQNVTCN